MTNDPDFGAKLTELDDALKFLWARIGWPPGHKYSPIPDIDDLKSREQKLFRQPHRAELFDIDLNEAGQIAFLDRLAASPPMRFPRSAEPDKRYMSDNDWFSETDAQVLAAIIRAAKPRRIIELGSGFSTSAIVDIQNELDGSFHLTIVDNNSESVKLRVGDNLPDSVTVVPTTIDKLDLSLFEELESGDILFTNSSHVSKVGSDVNVIFFDILPRLRGGVYIHFHDIFYPFEYPKEWVYDRRYWTEAYLLRAFLSCNRQYSIEAWSHYLATFVPQRFRKVAPNCSNDSGGSFWLKKLRSNFNAEELQLHLNSPERAGSLS